MREFILSKRYYLSASAILALITGGLTMCVLLENTYDSYGVYLSRVQTVDFNILSSSSTGTISDVIKKNDIQKANEIVMSNFCVFRMSINRCTDSGCSKKESLADNIDGPLKGCKYLAESVAVEIEVPIFSESNSSSTIRYPNSYTQGYDKLQNQAKPIGYLNLYRGTKASFNDDVLRFFDLWVSGKASAARYSIYKLGVVLSVFIAIVIFLAAFSFRLIYISELKRKILTKKLVRIIESRSE